MKKLTTLLLLLTLAFTFSACSGNTDIVAAPLSIDEAAAELIPASNTQATIALSPVSPILVSYDSDDLNAGVNNADISAINLEGDSISIDGTGATVDGNRVTINAAGTYNISGTLNNGQIIVDTEDKETVTLILSDANITNTESAPIYVVNADKTVITLADGTQNHITDGDTYVFENAETDEPNAAIFSKDDLTINGSGSLTVNANYNNGITGKDDLKITGGNITVNAVNDGIKGKDSIAVKDGFITINAGSDGMQSTNEEDLEKGYIAIEGGTINITAQLDGIQAETSVWISGGTLTVNTTGGDNATDSAKGIKAGVAITVTGGTIDVNSADDALHSNGSLIIDDGSLTLSAGDDGIHADTSVAINGGDITIVQSYEGIESAVIIINDGTIHLASDDDGINVAGGNDGSSINGRPGQNSFSASGDYYLEINGGYIFIDAVGDGLDSNGSITLNQGVVIVNGPTFHGNGALDCDGNFNITGGFLVAVGSSGMAEAPDTSSTQNSIMLTFEEVQSASTMIHIEAENGDNILTFVPTKDYQTIVVSSPNLETGETYVAYTGGSSTGTQTDGLYIDGTYTGGTQYASFTASDTITIEGSSAGGSGKPGGGRNRP